MSITHPDHIAGSHERITTMRYDAQGRLVEQAGAGTYPISYGYDAAGNRTTMTDGENSTTTWAFDGQNRVTRKLYADGKDYAYLYDAAGQLQTRRDSKQHVTTYGYNSYGLLTGIDYPSDPDVAFGYDALGRRTSMIDHGNVSTTWSYDAASRVVSDVQGHIGKSLTFDHDEESHRTSMQANDFPHAGSVGQTFYRYDEAGRLRELLDPYVSATSPFQYRWKANAQLISEVVAPSGLTSARSYDPGARLTNIRTINPQLTALNSYIYTYDAASQRAREVATVGTRKFVYDEKRQLTSAARVTGPEDTLDPLYTYGFAYDSIGNRLNATTNGNLTSYTANAVNQYTAITRGTTAVPVHDDNGNQTSDGANQVYEWDEENRLKAAVIGTQRSEFGYDGLSRRVAKRIYEDGVLVSERRFFYDGWNLLAEFDVPPATNAPTLHRLYTWGLDLSQTMQGAGGVGGLLSTTDIYGASHSYHYDGNGNVTDLYDASGVQSAHYEYSPYGETVQAIGAMAEANPFRFSTKYQDARTNLIYYGYRYYSPGVGRWLTKDPLGEEGGVNLYGVLSNDPINDSDFLGTKGNGHHIIPWALFNGAVKEEVQRFFDSDVARIFNDYYKNHNGRTLDKIKVLDYNKLVSEELKTFLGKQALKDMTLEQAKQFLVRIQSSPRSSAIAIYNNAVKREAALAMKMALKQAAERAAAGSFSKLTASGAKPISKAIGKGVPIVGTFVAVYFIAEDAKVYGWTPAIVSGGVDAIPLVGTGKVLGEIVAGMRFIEANEGVKRVNPAAGKCP